MNCNWMGMTVALGLCWLPLAAGAGELIIEGRASGGGVTDVRGVAVGPARMEMVGNSRFGARTRMVGEALGNADVYMAGDAFGPAALADSEVRAAAAAGSGARVNSINQSYHGRGVNRLEAEANGGGRVRADQVTSVHEGDARNLLRGFASGGETNLTSTLLADHGTALGTLEGSSLGPAAVTDLELLMDAHRSRQAGSMRGEARGSAEVRGLGVVRPDEILGDTRIRTSGCKSAGRFQASFFSP